MTSWFAYGVPVAALVIGVVGYCVIQVQSRAFDRRHAKRAPVAADQRPPQGSPSPS